MAMTGTSAVRRTGTKGQSISLDCLSPDVGYQATIVTDGINANHHAEDYHIEQKTLTASDTLSLKMASGGGFVVKVKR